MSVRFLLIAFLLLFNHSLFSQSNRERVFELLGNLNKDNPDSVKVNVLNDLSYEYLRFDPVVSLKYASQAQTLSQSINYPKGLSFANYLYASNLFLKYEFDSVFIYYEQSKEINELPENWQTGAKFEDLIGRIYHTQSDFNKAILHYKLSLAINLKLGEKEFIAVNYNNIGAAFYAQANYEKALENYFSSLEISEELGNKKRIAATLANIGGIYESQEKYDNAKNYYTRAIKIADESGDQITVADIYRNLGGIYTQKHIYDSAFVVYQNSLDIYLKMNDLRGVVVVYNFIAQTYVWKGEKEDKQNKMILFEKAQEFYNKSIEENGKGLDDIEEKMVSIQGLGEVYLMKNEYWKAIDYLNKALKMAQEIESFKSLEVSYDKLSKAYAGIGDYQKAYESHVLFKNWNDSLKSDQNVELLTQMSMQHEFDRQQQEQKYQQDQKDLEIAQKQKRDRLIRIFILTGLFVVSVFSIQMFRSFQRKKRDNILLEAQKAEIEKQKEEITDSIRYAKRIQTAILPSPQWAAEILPEHFILFRPRDIVSGDYYWMNKVGNKIIIVAADCTGHGVPGAFMSMLGVSFLNEIVNKNNNYQANLILNDLRSEVKRTLGQTGKEGEAKDGMDVALVVMDLETMQLQYAGAYNPLYLFRAGELIEIKADKMPIGIYVREKDSFTNNELELQKGDTFYIFSDGYSDQFGGPSGGKFKSKPFKELLGSIQDRSMKDQREILNTHIDDWRGAIDQVDDIIVLGIRI
jgi:serine phosphatase RsbU (regulator of sigma subunit)/Tfp pilus assembly protein PilF